MKLFENIIRNKCEECNDFLKEIEKFSKDRNSLFFIQQLRDSLVEILYTSDEWFLNINDTTDHNKKLFHQLQNAGKTINEYSNAMDDIESDYSKFTKENKR